MTSKSSAFFAGWEHDLARVRDPWAPFGDEDTDGEQEISAEEATQCLAQYVIDLKQRGDLNATQACTICFWASQAGLGGLVKELAVAPSDPEDQTQNTGRQSKTFDRVTGAMDDADDYYYIDVPCHHRTEGVRGTMRLPLWTPLDALEEDIVTDGELANKLQRAIDARKLPPSYFDHPVVTSAQPGMPVYPVAIYIDGTDFNRVDSCTGIWMINLLTDERKLMCAVRKSEACACGCRGWDTMFSVMLALHWSFRSMAKGCRPHLRHDGGRWRDDEQGRELVAGHSLPWRAVCLAVKNDMMEYVTNFGLPSWSDSGNPCPLCKCTKQTWSTTVGLSVLSLPWPEKDFADYNAACEACEHWVVIPNADMHTRIRAALRYDKSKGRSDKKDARGRALVTAIPELGLQQGDRLEPHAGLPDVALFDKLPPGSRVLFWRRQAETMCRRRNPLFSTETGIVPNRVLMQDWLHCLVLGPFKDYLAVLFHRLVDVNGFGVGSQDHHARVQESVGRVASLYYPWIEQQAAAGRQYAPAPRLSADTFGYSESHTLNLFGEETKGMMCFSPVLLTRSWGCFTRN